MAKPEQKKVCVLLATGFEEVEALTPIDYLRRANCLVVVLSTGAKLVNGGHNIRVDADCAAEDSYGQGMLKADFDAVVVPGGSLGAQVLAADPRVAEFIKRHFAAGKLIAAICAAPALVLHGSCHILDDRKFTGYPGTEKLVTGSAQFVDERVVVDRNLITAKAAGASGEFSRAIIEYLCGKTVADDLAEKVLLA